MQIKNEIVSTLVTVIVVSLVCSLMVAVSSVGLQTFQVENARKEKQLNIVKAAGLFEEGKTLEEMYSSVEAKLIDRETGKFVEDGDTEIFDFKKALEKDETSSVLDKAHNGASLGRVPNQLKVFLLKKDNKLDKVILPVQGKGLWGMMYGFLAMEADGKTISGITFYEHKETPGLGGEIVNPKWQALWVGKKPYDGDLANIQLVKTMSETPDVAEHQVDMLAGATLTSRGVENTLNFWFGEFGYKPFLTTLSQ